MFYLAREANDYVWSVVTMLVGWQEPLLQWNTANWFRLTTWPGTTHQDRPSGSFRGRPRWTEETLTGEHKGIDWPLPSLCWTCLPPLKTRLSGEPCQRLRPLTTVEVEGTNELISINIWYTYISTFIFCPGAKFRYSGVSELHRPQRQRIYRSSDQRGHDHQHQLWQVVCSLDRLHCTDTQNQNVIARRGNFRWTWI